MTTRILLHAKSCQLKLGVLTLPNRDNKIDIVKRILDDCVRLDIKTSLMSIIGFPTEKEREAWKTIQLYLDNAQKIAFVTLHQFSVSAGSPIIKCPDTIGIQLNKLPGLIQPRYEYINLNKNGMTKKRTKDVLVAMEYQIKEQYPQHEEIHTVGIGGWLTFLACCDHKIGFFKKKLSNPEHYALDIKKNSYKRETLQGTYIFFNFSVEKIEKAALEKTNCSLDGLGSCVVLSNNGEHVYILPGIFKNDLQEAYNGNLSNLSIEAKIYLRNLGLLNK